MDDMVGSGSDVLNKLLGGGYEKDVVTTIYGPAGAGKSTACLLAAISVASSDKKAIYVDTEGGFSATRLGQLAGNLKNEIISNILFMKPTTFDEQQKCIEKLRVMVNQKIGIIIIDTITNLYRSERSEDNAVLNRELGRQVSYLVEISRTKSIPVILANQVYSDFGEKGGVKMVGGDIISYNSKCLMELKLINSNKRCAILQKHRHIPMKEVFFEITNDGFSELKDKFKLF